MFHELYLFPFQILSRFLNARRPSSYPFCPKNKYLLASTLVANLVCFSSKKKKNPPTRGTCPCKIQLCHVGFSLVVCWIVVPWLGHMVMLLRTHGCLLHPRTVRNQQHNLLRCYNHCRTTYRIGTFITMGQPRMTTLATTSARGNTKQPSTRSHKKVTPVNFSRDTTRKMTTLQGAFGKLQNIDAL